MNVLTIDTSNEILGVAIIQNDVLTAQLITNIKKDHSSRLMPAITELMEKVALRAEELNKIVVATGPGSYTGTRIGVTTAKTLAWALGIPIFSISSLETLAYNGQFFNGYICPFFDARRQTVFTGLYEMNGKALNIVKEEQNVAMEDWLEEIAELRKPILFLSPHIEPFTDVIEEKIGENAVIPADDLHIPSPTNLYYLSKNRQATPVHDVIPNYLRITEAEANFIKQQKGDGKNG